MVTSKKTPAKKVVKRATTTTSKVIKSGATAGVAELGVKSALASTSLEKQKLVRDSFTMPKREYEQIGALKARLLKLEHAIKKGEVLRAGLAALTSMPDAELLALVSRIQRLKTGRPEKSVEPVKVPTKKKG